MNGERKSHLVQHKNKTVVKSMDLLTLFITRDQLTLNEMVQLSGIPKTSVHRMIGSLEDMGFLRRDQEGRYSLGLLFLQFGQLVADRLDIRQVALPDMIELRNEIGEAVNLIVKDGREALYIEKIDTLHPVRLYTKIGRRAPLYAGACSRIILSFLPEEEREQYLQQIELTPIARGTITDKEQLRIILEESRKHGYTISHSELEDYTFAVAAPIFDHHGRIAGGISLAGPEGRFQEERLPVLIDQLKQTSVAISRKLGWNE